MGGNAVHRANGEASRERRRGAGCRPERSNALPRRAAGAGGGGHHARPPTPRWRVRAHELRGEPGYLIGGLPLDLPSSYALGGGPRFVVEGDEYNAAYFDRGPKFLHYRPQTLIWTSGEYDHADLYASPEALLAAYRQLLAGMPADGLVVACGDRPEVRELAAEAPCRVVFYGSRQPTRCAPRRRGGGGGGALPRRVVARRARRPLAGLAGSPTEKALAVWAGWRRRVTDPQQVRMRCRASARRAAAAGWARRGVTGSTDCAHTPRGAAKIDAVRRRYSRRRVLAPSLRRCRRRSRCYSRLSRRPVAGRSASCAALSRLAPDAEERLDLDALAARLGEGGTAPIAPATTSCWRRCSPRRSAATWWAHLGQLRRHAPRLVAARASAPRRWRPSLRPAGGSSRSLRRCVLAMTSKSSRGDARCHAGDSTVILAMRRLSSRATDVRVC